MRDLKILAVQTRYAVVVLFRSPRVLMFGVVFPVVLQILFSKIFAAGKGNTFTSVDGHVIRTTAYYAAGISAYALMVQTFTALSIQLTTQRETGQLKRLRATPMRPWTFIGACVLRAVVGVAVSVVVVYAIGVLAFHVHLHAAGVLGSLVYLALGTLGLGTLGVAVTRLCPNTDAASTIGPFAAIILSFISGVFIPDTHLPSALLTIGKVFPLEHLASGLQHGLIQGYTGTGLRLGDVAILAAWALGGLVLAATAFRWEPQAATA
jgi:ABC-2 type transport system permease protein